MTFLAAVCREWEAAADLAGETRTVKIRTGLVLDPTGGALGKMLPLFRLGLGGKLGNGKQWWSWITLHDQIRAIVFALENPISGPVNVTAPNPVTNQEFTSALARAMHRPALFPAPALALKNCSRWIFFRGSGLKASNPPCSSRSWLYLGLPAYLRGACTTSSGLIEPQVDLKIERLVVKELFDDPGNKMVLTNLHTL